MSSTDVALVVAWHEALNAGDVDRLLSLSSDDVEVGGPRGAGRGAGLLQEWVARAGIRIEPGRVFQRDGTVVVEQSARWPSAESGQIGDAQAVASVFRVGDGVVTSVIRYPDLVAALQAAGLSEADETATGA